jgi:glycosyltransferase involved in cell wall biosynthesis
VPGQRLLVIMLRETLTLIFGEVSRVLITLPTVPTRVGNVLAIERMRFAALRRNRGTGVAVASLAARVGRSARFRIWRVLRRLGRPEDALSFLPQSFLSMQDDVLFVGYLEAALGLGESMRGLVRSVADTGLPFSLYPFSIGVETRLICGFMEERYDRRRRHRINVIEMAADQVPGLFRELGRWKTAHSYNILRTYWELPKAPAEWAGMLRDIDEIWAPNEFVARAFGDIFDGPITIIPPCVEIEIKHEFGRQRFDMNEDIFYFMFSFDYFSHPARKNPLGVIQAFREAFPDGDEAVGLVIKSTSKADHYPEIKTAIQEAARQDPRIKVIDRIFSRDEMLSMIRVSDCFISLHRSEGFGLGMAEAMAFGKAVIGTDYSGSTDFLSDRTGFPVAYTMRPVEPGEYICPDGQSWAEPDNAAAVEAMRRVFYDGDERARRAATGRALVTTRYAREQIGRVAVARLRKILAH